MKKTYIRPEASVIRLSAEASMMLAVSRTDGGSNDDGWSNQREWSDTDASFGEDEE